MNKFRIVLSAILLIVLFLLPAIFGPSFYENASIYYGTMAMLVPIVAIRFILDEKLEQRFRRRWRKARDRAFWLTVLNEGFRSFLYMIIILSIVQFAVYSRTPIQVVQELLQKGGFVTVFILLIVISIVIGIISWHENEKRFINH